MSEHIKQVIRDAGHTYDSLATEIGVTPQAIYATVHGHSKGATGRYSLARALGKQVSDLWPDSVPEHAA